MKRFDLGIIASMAVILLASFATLKSIALTSGENLIERQLMFVALGTVFFLAAAFFDYRELSNRSRLIYILGIIFLVLVLFLARNIRGSARWIELGFFNFQPVEFFKVALIIALARFFAVKRHEVKSGRVLFHSMVLVFIPIILVGLQPDLGSAMVLLAIWFGMLLVTRIRKSQIFALVGILLMLGGVAWYGLLHDYQRERVTTFLNPQADPQGSGYNVRQSVIAVGSGQFFGRGLGRGYQSHLRFLPERHTDFIFASFSEELGFVGAGLLIAAFAFLVWRIIRISLNSADALGMYLAMGIALVLTFQIFINIGMNIGLMPVTGIPLPLMSYGGSSLLATMFLLGVVNSVYKRNLAGPRV